MNFNLGVDLRQPDRLTPALSPGGEMQRREPGEGSRIREASPSPEAAFASGEGVGGEAVRMV